MGWVAGIGDEMENVAEFQKLNVHRAEGSTQQSNSPEMSLLSDSL